MLTKIGIYLSTLNKYTSYTFSNYYVVQIHSEIPRLFRQVNINVVWTGSKFFNTRSCVRIFQNQ